MANLKRCEHTLLPDGIVEAFALGQQDAQPLALSAEAIFTDHPQAADVLCAFDEVSRSGKHSLVVISGAPGADKSALIASSLKILVNKNVLLTMVKADQNSPVLPFSVFTAAFRSLTLQLLGLPVAEMAHWKAHISRVLGQFAGLAVNLVARAGCGAESESNGADRCQLA